ncbi:cortactin-binding protein 2-like isoform X2 [Saccostrea echinata]|uniref:cortactin-binding protein 2-like isoform X2 n=1 Tax=Saccostrea echinata TaxID=191078 RepID=UPI002A8307C6|nr:cortactin-binding protein 2-like isoform X2 [Saccostrea echinata]
MASSRNVKQPPGAGMYDPASKLQSNTLKRHPKMDLNKADLLRLLSYLEGELQARDIVIATMKAEKAKQLLYQAKYGRFGLGDPFSALQRDSDNLKDNSFDESAIKSMYDNQLAQLENLIATQRKAQLKMREQLSAAEKRYHKVCNELEDEKRKHAQDTAQGDDVTYMLEKERERLKQEIEYEKSQNKKLEKDLKKTLASLEEERANSIKHKQVAVMLIKEQKKLVEKLVKDRARIQKLEQQLQDEQEKTSNVVEGLVIESKKSLKMEAVMEKQMSDFDVEREQLRGKLGREEAKNRELSNQLEALQYQFDLLQKQMALEKVTASKDSFQSIEIKSTVKTPDKSGSNMAVVSPNIGQLPPKVGRMSEGSLKLSDVTDRNRVVETVVQKGGRYSHSPERSVSEGYRTDTQEMRVAPTEPVSIDRNAEMYRGGPRIPLQSGSTTVLTGGGKVLTVNVGHSSSPSSPVNMSPRKIAIPGRGTPPPLPPNKPSLSSPVTASPVSKAVTPVSQAGASRGVHIPVSVVHSSGTVTPTRASQGEGKAAPIRKPTQSLVSNNTDSAPNGHMTLTDTSEQSNEALEFLGPEMADLQNLLTSIMADSDNSLHLDGTPALSADVLNSPVHRFAADGNFSSLQKLILDSQADVNLPVKDGSTPLIFAAKYGHEDCVRLLLDNGASVSAYSDSNYTATHAASANGHDSCLKLLLERGANPNMGDWQDWTPLHLAATHGHSHCCCLLLDYGARLNVCSATTWTPLHSVVHSDQSECLEFLLDYHSRLPRQPGHVTTQELVDISDNDGWTVSHVAASKNSADCLSIISKYCNIDVKKTDRWGRSLTDVATPICNQFLSQLGSSCIHVPVAIELSYARLSGADNSSNITGRSFVVGTVQITSATGWMELEAVLQSVLSNFLSQLDTGIRTKKTSRLDPEITSDSVQYSLGLGLKAIQHYSIGSYHWVAGLHSVDNLPYDILCNNQSQTINIVLEGNLETVSCDVLLPVPVLQNYLRLLEHYKSVVFYGPEATGKTYLAHRMAHFVAKKEQKEGNKTSIHCVELQGDFSHNDLINLLVSTGCMVKTGADYQENSAPIVVLSNLERTDMAQLFGKLLAAVEHRGQYHTFTVDGQVSEHYCFVDKFYLIATMNKSRSTGLDLSIQQRFRWVHFRIDVEPIRNFLARYFLRKFLHVGRGHLPLQDSLVFRAVEWVLCIWQRLNDGLGKLGVPEVVFGPCHFLGCPIESQDPQIIYQWIREVWNTKIAPTVREAVIKGTGKETSSDGQQKVASTALYVLMQKAVVPGCPLTGLEKDQYLSLFSGSNELDIPIRADKSKIPVPNGTHSRRSLGMSRESTLGHKHRKSLDDKESEVLSQGIKKRSSSETSIKNSIEYEGSPLPSTNFSTAKMPKLEIRTPFIFPPESRSRWDGETSGYQSDTTEPPLRTFSFSAIPKKPAGVGPHNSSGGEGQPTRRSRSSENLLDGGGETKPKSPFSFSLTTPTSLLSSFKFLETKSRTNSPSSALPRNIRSQSESSSSTSKADLQHTNSGSITRQISPNKTFQTSGDRTEFTPQKSVQTTRQQNQDRTTCSSEFTQNLHSFEFTQQRTTQNNRLQSSVRLTSESTKPMTSPVTRLQNSQNQAQKENIYVSNQPNMGDNSFISNSNSSGGEKLLRNSEGQQNFPRNSEGQQTFPRNSEEQQSFPRKSTDSPFLRNSKLRKSIEKILPDSPFIRDSEGRRSFGKSESPFRRNSSSRKSLEKVQNENAVLNESMASRSHGNLHHYQERYVRPGVDKQNSSLESEL